MVSVNPKEFLNRKETQPHLFKPPTLLEKLFPFFFSFDGFSQKWNNFKHFLWCPHRDSSCGRVRTLVFPVTATDLWRTWWNFWKLWFMLRPKKQIFFLFFYSFTCEFWEFHCSRNEKTEQILIRRKLFYKWDVREECCSWWLLWFFIQWSITRGTENVWFLHVLSSFTFIFIE